jgi:hypothetical protein
MLIKVYLHIIILLAIGTRSFFLSVIDRAETLNYSERSLIALKDAYFTHSGALMRIGSAF